MCIRDSYQAPPQRQPTINAQNHQPVKRSPVNIPYHDPEEMHALHNPEYSPVINRDTPVHEMQGLSTSMPSTLPDPPTPQPQPQRPAPKQTVISSWWDDSSQAPEPRSKLSRAAGDEASTMSFNISATVLKAYKEEILKHQWKACLLYTSPSPRDRTRSRMPSSA